MAVMIPHPRPRHHGGCPPPCGVSGFGLYDGAMTRSMLYVPGDRPAMLEKAARRGADMLILDLEDAVPMSSKAEARAAVRAAIPILQEQGARVGVRINSLASERNADLAAFGEGPPDAFMVAKATAAVIEEVAGTDSVAEVPLLALIESARGLLDAPEIAEHPRVAGLAMGEADLGADIGMSVGDEDEAWTPSRTRVVWAAAAAGLPAPIGPVYIDLKDLHGLRRSTERLRMLGFGGCSAVHPSQVEVINEVFHPDSTRNQGGARIRAGIRRRRGGRSRCDPRLRRTPSRRGGGTPRPPTCRRQSAVANWPRNRPKRLSGSVGGPPMPASPNPGPPPSRPL